jgi:hypothetical protein
MTRKGKTQESPLGLDMPFDKAMERFMQTDPNEVGASIARSKKKKPGGKKAPPGNASQQKTKFAALRGKRQGKLS